MTAETAIKVLQQILTDPDAEDRDKIAVAKDLLDRGGLGATSKVLVGIGSTDPVEQLFQDILRDPRMFQEPIQAERVYIGDGEDSPLLALESSFEGFDDVIDAEVVEGPAAERHTIHVGGEFKTPRHIREALAKLL
jgi:hypothetical protein